MEATLNKKSIFRKVIALPQDHGSWVFLLSPLAIGLFAGGHWSLSSMYLVIAALAAFLIRQPMTVLVKVYSKRRNARDLPVALFWSSLYAIAGILAVIGLITQGYIFILLLVLPAIPVFTWHLYLVSRRSERRQMGIEIVATGVLALVAPAGLWVGLGRPDPAGWLLWVLTWLQSGASIVYAYLRLEQRVLKNVPDFRTRLIMGQRALLYTSFNLAVAIGLAILHVTTPLLPLAYAVQWAESIWGTLRPAVGLRPVIIGGRQTIISTLFTLLFIFLWR